MTPFVIASKKRVCEVTKDRKSKVTKFINREHIVPSAGVKYLVAEVVPSVHGIENVLAKQTLFKSLKKEPPAKPNRMSTSKYLNFRLPKELCRVAHKG